MPRKWFKHDVYPYRTFPWERDGKAYECLGIKKWKTKVPDVSKHVKSMLPKSFHTHISSKLMEKMLAETCVAELVHTLLAIFGFGCILVWRDTGGFVMGLLYCLGNIPFILIQRYNRPRHRALMQALKERGR